MADPVVFWYLVYFFKRFRSFNSKDLGPLDQRASKLQAVNVGGLKQKSAAQPRPHSNQSARIQEPPGSNHSQSLLACNFPALDLQTPNFQLAMTYWALYLWLNQDYLLWSLRCIPSLFLLNLQSCVVVLGTFAANSIPYVRMALLYTHLILDRKKSNLFAIDKIYPSHSLLIENINIL